MSYLHKIWHNADYPCIGLALLRQRNHLHRSWSRKEIFNRDDVWWVKQTSATWHSMSENNLFSDHKVTLALIKVKVCFLAIARDWEIIHECSQFGQRRSPSYTSEVKLVRCKDQRHSPVGECAEGQVKIVLLGRTNLVMTRISVKVLEEWVFS